MNKTKCLVGVRECISWVMSALTRNVMLTYILTGKYISEMQRWDQELPSGICISNHQHSQAEIPIIPTLALIWRKPTHLNWQKHAVVFISITKHANVTETFWLTEYFYLNTSGNWSICHGTNSSTIQVKSRENSFFSLLRNKLDI